jgi:hypothetical protein
MHEAAGSRTGLHVGTGRPDDVNAILKERMLDEGQFERERTAVSNCGLHCLCSDAFDVSLAGGFPAWVLP